MESDEFLFFHEKFTWTSKMDTVQIYLIDLVTTFLVARFRHLRMESDFFSQAGSWGRKQRKQGQQCFSNASEILRVLRVLVAFSAQEPLKEPLTKADAQARLDAALAAKARCGHWPWHAMAAMRKSSKSPKWNTSKFIRELTRRDFCMNWAKMNSWCLLLT